jgi:hypothetical protein
LKARWYSEAAAKARKIGVEFLAYRASASLTGVGVGEKITIEL